MTGNETYYESYQRQLRDCRWSWADMPFYDGPGTRPDIVRFHDLDYLDVYERVYGRQIGANGIGRLREVGLVRPSRLDSRPWEAALPTSQQRQRIAAIDLELFAREQDGYAAALEQEGVLVHWIDPRDDVGQLRPPAGGYWAAGDLLIAQGGAVVGRSTWNPLTAGWREWLSAWAFWELNIPTLLTVSGHGIADAGATVWLADDVFVVGLSLAYNDEGMEQLVDKVKLTSRCDELQVLVIHCQGDDWFNRQVGTSAHVTNLLAPLDRGKVLCYLPGIDTNALLWLRRRGYEVLEADPEDQVRHAVCNLVLLEPGRVLMPAGAHATIQRVRDAGITVVPVPYSALTAAGGGLRAATMEILREQRPLESDR